MRPFGNNPLRRALTTALAAGIAASVFATRPVEAQATPIDSLVLMLRAPTWQVRARALSEIRGMSEPLPVGLRTAIVALVQQEALTAKEHAGDEAFGEYVIDIVAVAVKTRDQATIPALIALGGIGIGSGIAAFIASGGPSILPALDSAERASPLDAGVLLETVGLMYARHGALLNGSDSAAVLSRIYGAASSPIFTARSMLAELALRIPLPDLVPALRVLAASDTFRLMPENFFPVRHDAQTALDSLNAAWSALPAPAMLAALGRETAGACATASGAIFGHCQSMNAHLATATQHLNDANRNPVLNAIKNFRKTLEQAGRAGLTPLTVTLMDANAARLSELLR